MSTLSRSAALQAADPSCTSLFGATTDRSAAAAPRPGGGLRNLFARWSGDPSARQAQQACADAEHRFDVLFEASGEGLVLCDADGIVLVCNAAAARLCAEPPATLVGSRFAGRFLGAARGTGDLSGPRRGEMLLRRAQGEPLLVQVHVTEMRTSGPRQRLVQLREASVDNVGPGVAAAPPIDSRHDSLTGLPDRALFRDRLGLAMERSKRSGAPLALMFLDLDRFKVVNDSLGHEVGDRLLKHVAQQLTHCLRSVDSLIRCGAAITTTVSRLGGDEFTVIAEAIGGAEDAALIAQRMLDALTVPFCVGEEEIVISGSIGISLFPTDDVDLDGLIRHTDMAMYRSKSLGRGTYTFFSDDLNAAVSARLSLEGGLRKALERNEFLLHFQPKVDLRSGEVTGVEALIRWHCPTRGMVPPDRFIAVLEDTGLILPVGAWVIRAACAQMAAWDRLGMPPLRMAVNMSARQFRHQHLAALVEETLRECDVDPRRLEIELTETLLMEDTEANRNMLESFTRMGVGLAIDDFGTGHSSLSYLKRFKIDTLKIDRSFVADLPDNADDAAIASAVVALGHSLQMRVVAEGVETERQADFLRGLGCDEMQGYLLSRPLPAADFVVWWRQHQSKLAVRRRSVGRGGSADAVSTLMGLDTAELPA